MDLAYILNLIMSVLGIFLLAATYFYIDKLEKTGCACSEYRGRKFLKNYSLFAIVLLVGIMFFPPSLFLGKPFPINEIVGGILVVYLLVTLYYFISLFRYVRFLVEEKCKCSEDMRREVIYLWSLLEIIILASMMVIPIVIGVAGTAIVLGKVALKEGSRHSLAVMDATVNPLKSAKKIPKNISNISASIKKLARRK